MKTLKRTIKRTTKNVKMPRGIAHSEEKIDAFEFELFVKGPNIFLALLEFGELLLNVLSPILFRAVFAVFPTLFRALLADLPTSFKIELADLPILLKAEFADLLTSPKTEFVLGALLKIEFADFATLVTASFKIPSPRNLLLLFEARLLISNGKYYFKKVQRPLLK
jgi:hypothetical protein